MTTENSWPKVAVVGAGGVGGVFGGLLARSGVPVTMIGRTAFVEAVRKSGLRLDTMQFQETLHPAASTEISATAGGGHGVFCENNGHRLGFKGTRQTYCSLHDCSEPAKRCEQCRRDSQGFRH